MLWQQIYIFATSTNKQNVLAHHFPEITMTNEILQFDNRSTINKENNSIINKIKAQHPFDYNSASRSQMEMSKSKLALLNSLITVWLVILSARSVAVRISGGIRDGVRTLARIFNHSFSIEKIYVKNIPMKWNWRNQPLGDHLVITSLLLFVKSSAFVLSYNTHQPSFRVHGNIDSLR